MTKGIRIQPKELEVPKCDPFKNDLLGRKESIEALTSIVGSIEGPCVLAVDSGWGMGKTTFLKMWTQHLRNQGFPVVDFNAWESDFAENAFLALSSEITKGLEEYTEVDQGSKKLRKDAAKVMRALPVPLLRVALSMIPYAGPQIAKELESASLDSLAENVLSEYQEAKEAFTSFRKTLENTAECLAQSKGGKPLVMVIDELDRCRPTYAIELLEVAKHLFSVDRIVFVLTLDRAQLAHSIKVLYGNDFDGEGYLGRFFDADFRLPDPRYEQFINAMIRGLQIQGRFQQNGKIYQNLVDFFGKSGLDLRSIGQSVHRLALVLASIPEGRKLELIAVVALLIVRTTDLSLYRRFIRGQATDKEVVDTVFTRSGVQTLDQRQSWSVFEAMIIVGAKRLNHESELEPTYQRIKSPPEPNEISQEEQRHAGQVLGTVETLEDPVEGLRFQTAVERLELIVRD